MTPITDIALFGRVFASYGKRYVEVGGEAEHVFDGAFVGVEILDVPALGTDGCLLTHKVSDDFLAKLGTLCVLTFEREQNQIAIEHGDSSTNGESSVAQAPSPDTGVRQ